MTTFNWTGKRGQAAKGKSDDLIMSLAIGCFIVKPNGNFQKNAEGSISEWQQAFLASVSRTSNTMHSGVGTYGQKIDENSNPLLGLLNPKVNLKPQTQSEYYNGVKLKPGVKAEQVAAQHIMQQLYGWVGN
jgi:hypothetical protein